VNRNEKLKEKEGIVCQVTIWKSWIRGKLQCVWAYKKRGEQSWTGLNHGTRI
jgi:hypothetical protein